MRVIVLGALLTAACAVPPDSGDHGPTTGEDPPTSITLRVLPGVRTP